MAVCVIQDGTGHLVPTGDPVETCSGWVMLSTSEYTDLPSLTEIFTIPLASDLAQMWQVGFSLPIILWLSAWALGIVVSFINTK